MESLTSVKKQIRNYLVVGLGILGLTCAINSQAGVIALPVGVGGPGFGDDGPIFGENWLICYGDTGEDCPDEGIGEGDYLQYYKAFEEVGYIDLIFLVTPDLPNGHALSNSVLVDEYIYNGTGITWTDYHLELGYALPNDGTECDAVGIGGCFDYDFITPADGDTGLYFTEYGAENFTTVSEMPAGDHPNMIWFDDGIVPSGEEFYVYSDFVLPDFEDVPDYARLPDCNECIAAYAVVLRQSPSTGASVPEPSIIALFAAGLFGIGFVRGRKA